MRNTYPTLCACCSVLFFAKSQHAAYCSTNCRVRAYYYRRSGRPVPPIKADQPARTQPIRPQVIQPEILEDPDDLPLSWRIPAEPAPGMECRHWNGTAIRRRESDGYVNATAMAKANGKHLPHYLANDRTREYLRALSGSVGIPTDLLVRSIVTGPNDQRGTWVHQRVAVDLARWVSPSFAVWMDGWFLESLSRPAPQPAPQLPRLPSSGPAILIRAKTYREAAQIWCDALEAAAAGAIRHRYSARHRGPHLLSLPTSSSWQHLPT